MAKVVSAPISCGSSLSHIQHLSNEKRPKEKYYLALLKQLRKARTCEAAYITATRLPAIVCGPRLLWTEEVELEWIVLPCRKKISKENPVLL